MYFSLTNLPFLANSAMFAAISAIVFPTGNMLLWLDANSGASRRIAGDSGQHWLDLTSGKLSDYSGISANNYILLNGASFATGATPYYTQYDGINDYTDSDADELYVADRRLYMDLGQPFTWSIWAYYSGVPDSGYIRWMGVGDGTGSGFYMTTLPKTSYNRGLELVGSGDMSFGNISCPSGAWFNATITRNTDNRITGYINATGVGWQKVTGGATSGYFNNSPMERQSGLVIAANTLSGITYFDGANKKIAAVYAYSGALSSGLVSDIFNLTRGTYGV